MFGRNKSLLFVNEVRNGFLFRVIAASQLAAHQLI